MQKGYFITFEGPDGAGKSTQIKLLETYLKEKGLEVVLTREPGGTRISEKIREIILNKTHTEMSDVTEALLYAASRAQHVHEVIKPALLAGKVVICDRFVHSSLAYQGNGRELGEDMVWAVNAPAVDGIMPDLSFFVMLDEKHVLSRLEASGKDLDRLEREKVDFFKRVNAAYHKMAVDSDRVLRLDASESIESIAAKIKNAAKNTLKLKKLT